MKYHFIFSIIFLSFFTSLAFGSEKAPGGPRLDGKYKHSPEMPSLKLPPIDRKVVASYACTIRCQARISATHEKKQTTILSFLIEKNYS